MERKQIDWQHDYLLSPWDYPISENNAHATYDQFITLRDTLVFSNKYYADSAGRSLIIWTKLDGNPTNTIEIWEPNMFMQSFEPYGSVSWEPLWKYIATWWHTSQNPMSCEIVKDGRYVLQHKQQLKGIPSSITRVHSFILQHRWDVETERAVFDWERTTPWEFNRLTTFGYVECDLKKWDWLEWKMLDQDDVEISWNILQPYSNRWMVEYKDLSYNNN